MSAPYARFFTPPLHGGSFPLPRAKDVVKTSVFTRPRKRDSSKHPHWSRFRGSRQDSSKAILLLRHHTRAC